MKHHVDKFGIHIYASDMAVNLKKIPRPIKAAFEEYDKTSGFCASNISSRNEYVPEIVGYKTSYDSFKGGAYCSKFDKIGYMSVEECAEQSKQ
jgi:hypothetical protein